MTNPNRLTITFQSTEMKAIKEIQKKTGLSKNKIVNKLIKKGLEDSTDIFYFHRNQTIKVNID